MMDALFRDADPIIAEALECALSGGRITERQGEELFGAMGTDVALIGMVADELRRRAAGSNVTYVINRNINFTNVCIKQCGFCAFSRDFREEEGYYLPIEEIVRRTREAHTLGATEVCIQAGLPPDMEAGVYEDICRAIKKEVPGIHIHGFSPEEVLYGASRSGVTIREYLGRLREAGVDTLPGTSAEILDQGLRDVISPGRITVREWTDIIRTAHKMGIRTTSTMMYGHAETALQKARHLAHLRHIQDETGGFTEFVPLGFIAEEAPMYRRGMVRAGAGAQETLLAHAVSRIMLDNVRNLQVSWVKEGPAISQVLLHWGANDMGGTLINESISTAAGASHGQLMRPNQMRRLISGAGRIPVQRDTHYTLLRESENPLDEVDSEKFGSYFELVKIKKFKYANPRN